MTKTKISIENAPESYFQQQQNLPRVSLFSSKIAGTLDEMHDEYVKRNLRRLEAESSFVAAHIGELVKGSGLAANGLAIDLGCGYGPASRHLAKKIPSYKVLGLDINDGAIKTAIELTKESLPNLEFHVADGDRLVDFLRGCAFPGNKSYGIDSFYAKADLIVCRTIFYRFDDLEHLLSQVKKALKDGGVVYIADMDRSYIWRYDAHQMEVGEGKNVSLFEAVYDDLRKLKPEEIHEKYFSKPSSDVFRQEVRQAIEYAASYIPFEVVQILDKLNFQLGRIVLVPRGNPSGFVLFARKKPSS